MSSNVIMPEYLYMKIHIIVPCYFPFILYILYEYYIFLRLYVYVGYFSISFHDSKGGTIKYLLPKGAITGMLGEVRVLKMKNKGPHWVAQLFGAPLCAPKRFKRSWVQFLIKEEA